MSVLAATWALAKAAGGVSTGLTEWYRADVASTVVGSPGTVSAWNNFGGSATGYNFTEGTASYRPGYISGSTNYKQYNYNPRVDFNSASYSRLQNTGPTPNLYGTAGSIFLVANQKPLGGDGTGLTYCSDFYSQRIQMKPAWRIQTSAGYSGYTADFGLPTENDTLDASMFSLSGLGSSAVQRRNSVDLPCNNCGS